MKILKMLVLAGLMGSSVAAMAEGGGDIVAARMDAARDHAMAHYEQVQDQQRAVAAAHDQAQQQQAPQSAKSGS
ncbi:co-regulatory protein PtrA N-terminal domain-containing protein [Pseudomonas sp. App30]|uniref:co-regulatory protein PtrA N-terminal domain-containing protein n=1 Tax=Pseudomonas sp. App30 TaxID=3068990 RepID=UPI003A7FEC4B